MAVTADEYELPVAVEARLCDLAKKLGRSRSSVATMFCRGQRFKFGRKLIRIVRLDLEEETD